MDGKNSKIGLNWMLSVLNNLVCQCDPLISLNLIGFELAKADKGHKLEKLQHGSVTELKISAERAGSTYHPMGSNGSMDSFNYKALPHCCLTDTYSWDYKAFICIHRLHHLL